MSKHIIQHEVWGERVAESFPKPQPKLDQRSKDMLAMIDFYIYAIQEKIKEMKGEE